MPIYEQTRLKKNGTIIIKNLKSRKQALLHALIHIPPVVITFGVLSLTFRNIFWQAPSDESNSMLNGLQFAAQFHGSLIIASLSAMLLHVAHHEMAGEKGAPLGFISSSFQLNSLAYLFRREFTSLKVKYILGFLFAFSLAIFSGPSSAITMIPRLQYWSVDKMWYSKGSVDFRVFIESTESNLYPEILTAENSPSQCFSTNASLLVECPSYGIRQLVMEDDLFQKRTGDVNKTIQSEWVRYMVGTESGLMKNRASSYIASTMSIFLGDVLWRYEAILKSFTTLGQRVMGVRAFFQQPEISSTQSR